MRGARREGSDRAPEMSVAEPSQGSGGCSGLKGCQEAVCGLHAGWAQGWWSKYCSQIMTTQSDGCPISP